MDSNHHWAGFEPAASADWATRAVGAVGGSRTHTRCLEGSYARPLRHDSICSRTKDREQKIKYQTGRALFFVLCSLVVPSAGHDPATSRVRAACAAYLRHDGILVPLEGFEPPSPRLKGACVAVTPQRHWCRRSDLNAQCG